MYNCDFDFLHKKYNSENEFHQKLKENYSNDSKCKNLYLICLTELHEAISKRSIEVFNRMYKVSLWLKSFMNETTVTDADFDDSNPLKGTNLVILACKYNSLKILNELFKINFWRFMGSCASPDAVDRMGHDAMYYALRTGNLILIHSLIDEWPEGFFETNPRKLDCIISKAYEKLANSNVPIPREVQWYVAEKLTSLRFLSESKPGAHIVVECVEGILERVDFLSEQVCLLEQEYKEGSDETFIFICKSIACNIHILKLQLRSSYVSLPWEEVEYCLISYILAQTKQCDTNVYVLTSLNKEKVLYFLLYFVKSLLSEKCKFTDKTIKELKTLPKLSRSNIQKRILKCFPEFKDLYNDFKKTRDMHSLLKIESHIERLVKADALDRIGQLEISWCVLVIGEHLKCSLESPKLSEETSEQVVGALREETRKAIVQMRDGLAHEHSLSDRAGLPAATFCGLQEDLRQVGQLVHFILQRAKHTLALELLEIVSNGDGYKMAKKAMRGISCLGNVSYMGIHSLMYYLNNAKQLVIFLKNNVTNKTIYDDNFFDDMLQKFEQVYNNLKLAELDYELFSDKVNHFYLCKKSKKFLFRDIKHFFEHVDRGFQNRSNIVSKNFPSLILMYWERLSTNSQKELIRLTWYVHRGEGLGRLDKFRSICKKAAFKNLLLSNSDNESRRCSSIHENVLELKFVMNDHKNDYSNSYPIMAKKMMGMNILSVLDREKCLENNLFFLDSHCPLITGKNLRNYLAHDNQIIEILPIDPDITLELNVDCLLKLKFPSIYKIGYPFLENIKNLRTKFEESMNDVRYLQKTIEAIIMEDMDALRSLIERGSETRSRSLVNCKSLLHWAVAGRSLELVKYLVAKGVCQGEVDTNGESALHVAAAEGTAETVLYLVETLRDDVHCRDRLGMTPLHHAARRGDVQVIRTLLSCDSSLSIKCYAGYLPIHHAIIGGNRDAFNVLREADPLFDFDGLGVMHIASAFGQVELLNYLIQLHPNVNVNAFVPVSPLYSAAIEQEEETMNVLLMNGADVNFRFKNEYSVLHIAAIAGFPGVARLLLKNKADVNIRDHHLETPLHQAIIHGNFEVVKILIEGGADLNAFDCNGSQSLILALNIGSENVAKLLIKKGVNLKSNFFQGITPLHLASLQGFENIINLLINAGESVNSRDNRGKSPLHYACDGSQVGAVKLLIKNGANVHIPDAVNRKPLWYAVRSLCLEIILVFMEKYNICSDDADYLLVALTSFNVDLSNQNEIVKILTENNCNVSKYDLLVAVSCNKDMIEIILEKIYKLDWIEEAVTAALSSGRSEDIVETLLGRVALGGRAFRADWLALACRGGYKRAVRRLLEGCRMGGSLLHEGAAGGCPEVVGLLLGRGADPELPDTGGRTPLYLAAERGHVAVVRLLLANHARLQICDLSPQGTPLYAALKNGHHQTARALLDAQTPLDDEIFRDQSLMLYVICSIQTKHLENTMLLIDKYKKYGIINKYHEGKSLMHFAAAENNVHIIEYLVINGADLDSVSDEGDKPIHLAAKKGLLRNLEFLLKCGTSFLSRNKSLQTLLHCAVLEKNKSNITGRMEVLRYLLEHRMDVNSKDFTGSTPLHLACKSGHVELVRIIIEFGAVFDLLDNDGKMPVDLTRDITVKVLLMSINKLFVLVKKNDLLLIRKLIQKDSSIINAKNSKGKTVLHYACWKGNTEIINCLLKFNANPEVFDDKGWGPIHYCAKYCDYIAFFHLLDHGASYNPLSASGKKPSDLAMDSMILDTIEMITVFFHKVQTKDSLADIQEHYETSKIPYKNRLLSFHIATHSKNRNGKTVKDLAHETGNIKFINLINRYSAEYHRISA